MRNLSLPRRRVLARLATVVALTALAAGAPMASATGSTHNRDAVPVPAAPAPTWSLVGTMDTQHLATATTVLHFYGVFWIGAQGAQFHEQVPESVNQVAFPSVRVPAAGTHTYRLVVHVRAATEATRFQVDGNPAVTVPAGATTFEHVQTLQTTGPSWRAWGVRAVDNATWFFISADVYVQVG